MKIGEREKWRGGEEKEGREGEKEKLDLVSVSISRECTCTCTPACTVAVHTLHVSSSRSRTPSLFSMRSMQGWLSV